MKEDSYVDEMLQAVGWAISFHFANQDALSWVRVEATGEIPSDADLNATRHAIAQQVEDALPKDRASTRPLCIQWSRPMGIVVRPAREDSLAGDFYRRLYQPFELMGYSDWHHACCEMRQHLLEDAMAILRPWALLDPGADPEETMDQDQPDDPVAPPPQRTTLSALPKLQEPPATDVTAVESPVEPESLPEKATPAPVEVSVTDVPSREIGEGDGVVELTPMDYVNTAQIQGVILSRNDADQVRQLVLSKLMDWLSARKGINVPADWRTSPHWERGTEGNARQVWFEAAGPYAALRFDEPCGEVLGRSWRVEMVMTEIDGRVHVGARVSAMIQSGVPARVRASIPQWVRAIVKEVSLVSDGQLLSARPQPANGEEPLAALVELIRRRSRSLAVLVACDDGSERFGRQLERIARQVGPAAHVFVVSPAAVDPLRKGLGLGAGIPVGGARLFLREFDAQLASVHAPVIPARMLANPAGIERVVSACAAQSVAYSDPGDLPSFARIRQLIERERRREDREKHDRAKADDAATVRRLRAVVASMEEDIAVAESLAGDASQRLSLEQERVRRLEGLLMQRDQQIDVLRQRLEARLATATHDLETWDGIEQWVNEQYAHRFVLTPGAMRIARRSVYENLGLVRDVIAMLADIYWPLRAYGDDTMRQALVDRCKELRVEVCQVGEAINNRKLKGQYQTTHRGQSYTLDMHVSGSSSRDRRRGFRLYFTWDPDAKLVVCGSLPDHLDNGLT